jgi:hypothetical protein
MYGLRMFLVSIHLVTPHRHHIVFTPGLPCRLQSMADSHLGILLSISSNLTSYALGDQALKIGLKYAM